MKQKRLPWLCNNCPLFSLVLDLPVSRALILGLLPCTAHYCSYPYLQRNCETLLKFQHRWAWVASVFQFHPRGCSLGMNGSHGCLAAVLQCDPQLGMFTRTPAAGMGRVSAAVLLHCWQWCKMAGTAVFKHCICRQLHNMKSLRGTRIAGAEKLGV